MDKSKLSFDAELLSVYKLFKNDAYQIPAYQRDYAWDTEQWGQLWDDLSGYQDAHTEDPGYICRETEKASNIQSVRHLFNIKPGQNITPQMLKPYITGEKKDGNISWLLLCWASKGFKDIRLFLADINKLAFQDTKPTDNTKLV